MDYSEILVANNLLQSSICIFFDGDLKKHAWLQLSLLNLTRVFQALLQLGEQPLFHIQNPVNIY